MPSCSVIGCGVRKSQNQPFLTLHRLPSNEIKKREWLERIGVENIKTNVKTVFICSLHFDEKCIKKTLKVPRVQEDAVPSKFLAMAYELTEVWKGEAFRNRKLAELKELIKEKAERAAKSELAGKMRVAKGYYTLEMAPPTSGELKKLTEEIKMVKEFIRSGGHKDLTVRQAWLLLLVGIEVGLWFFLGESLGKFHIVGYKVNP